MEIEFRCELCGKLLRTGPENAGRPARCPGCGNTLTVPEEGGAQYADSVAPIDEKVIPGYRAAPHRGGLILALGILSWVTCFVFGIAAWALAIEDLQAMRAGEMDQTGESLTRVGMYLGIANVVLMGVIFLGALAIFVIAAVSVGM